MNGVVCRNCGHYPHACVCAQFQTPRAAMHNPPTREEVNLSALRGPQVHVRVGHTGLGGPIHGRITSIDLAVSRENYEYGTPQNAVQCGVEAPAALLARRNKEAQERADAERFARRREMFLKTLPNGLIVGDDLKRLQEYGIIKESTMAHLNASSIDVTLGGRLLVESYAGGGYPVISLRNRDPLPVSEYLITEGSGYLLKPNRFILAHTQQSFDLPACITAQYMLKSSMARVGLEHMHAGFADPGWKNSVLTLELKNVAQGAVIELHRGDRIGQVVFFKHRPVAQDQMYRGRYNGDMSVQGVKK